VAPAARSETIKTVRAAAPSQESAEPELPPAVNPARVLEAILFVGGSPITCKRLCSVLGGNIDQTFVEQRVDELNSEYTSQGRPYEIRLGEGGYRLTLKPEFESVRNKVYGAGPREVKLSQDALEVLALVAYQQPISQTDVEASGKRSAGNLLRQLIRRELVGITRIDSTRSGIRYQTTPRFLSLFGLASIDELPKADELSMR
jgi:segregation and condensation protein B